MCITWPTAQVWIIILSLAGAASAEEVPGIAGRWALNREQSDDLGARIQAVAGSQYMSGRPSWASETWVPWSGGFSEPERLRLREFLLATVPAFDGIQIRARAEEIETTHGEAGVRLFNLKRKSAGTSMFVGETVRREARLDGPRLILESKGKDSRLRETFTLETSGNRLVYVLRLEGSRLEAPLEARLVYDRVP
jgi:hypothetical protein